MKRKGFLSGKIAVMLFLIGAFVYFNPGIISSLTGTAHSVIADQSPTDKVGAVTTFSANGVNVPVWWLIVAGLFLLMLW